ncbi:MAG: hypothetical protein MRZ79_13230 [Bacteroidia bacterium]|nr:hypothetical protein [Bacteroidia bacterium]
MIKSIRISSSILALAFLLSSCVTAYQASGFTGGYEQMRLNDNTYNVSFHGNGFTTESLTSVFILRRCAELTLENGRRYFELLNSNTNSTVGGFDGNIYSYPSSKATIRVLESKHDAGVVLDAVFIMEETAKAAKGNISPKASAALQQIKKLEYQAEIGN